VDGYKVTDSIDSLGTSVGEELLKPHRCYSRILQSAISNQLSANSQQPLIKGMAHLTGGGFFDNIPRILPSNVDVVIHKGTWPILPIFQLLQKDGKVPDEEMFHVFNMGIGMVLSLGKNSESHPNRIG